MKKSFIINLSLFLISFFSLIATPVFADDSLQCQEIKVPIKLSSIDTTEYRVYGKLCSRGPLTGKTVQVLIHGITYDHNYWDFPYAPDVYSYVEKSTAAGFATFSIDRIGIGQSDHPPAASVTSHSNAYVVHQLVQGLRSGTIGNTSFAKVMLVGHSYGSITSLIESATYQDVDGVILTGLLHQASPVGSTTFMTYVYPAQLDPKFSSANLPDGYLTTIPGKRGPAFYNTSFADPNVIALDEQLKQTVTTAEFATLMDGLVPEYSQNINVPVLLVMGEKDNLFCDAVLSCANSKAILQRESSYFNPNAKLKAFVVPNAGHDVNLHPNANAWYGEATEWALENIGNSN